MLLALPIIAVALASYFQFAFIRHDALEGLRPWMWDALEDLKGIMRRRMTSWMQPISAAIPKLALPAPIPTSDLSMATSNQTLTVAPPSETATIAVNALPFGIPAWIALRFQQTPRIYLFNFLCGAVVSLCLAGVYACLMLLMTPTSRSTTCDHQREHTGKLKRTDIMSPVTHSSTPVAGTFDSVSESVLPNPPTTSLHDSTPGATVVSGPVNGRLPITPTIPESRLNPLVLSSRLPPAIASQPLWEELRVPSNESPDAMDLDLSRDLHREVMIVEGAVAYNTAQSRTIPRRYGQQAIGSSRVGESDAGVIYSTPLASRPSSLTEESPGSQPPTISQITVKEYQEPSKVPTLDRFTSVDEPVECPLGARLAQEVSTARDLAAESSLGISGSTFSEPRLPLGDSLVNLGANVSTIRDSSDDSTPRVIPEIGQSATSLGGTPGLLQIQLDLRDHEGNLVPASAASATWVGFVALKGSLVHLCSSTATRNIVSDGTDGARPSVIQDNDLAPVNPLDHYNAWINHEVDSLEPLGGTDDTSVIPDTSDKDNTYIYSECIEHLRTSSNSSTSIGWMSQRSLSTHPDTPLVTPSNSIPCAATHLDEQPCPKADPDYPGSTTDFLFERQLSQASSPPSATQDGDPSEGANKLNSFAEVQPDGHWSMDLDAAPASNTSSELHTLHSFLDDRTYAEVAGVPAAIESASATVSLSRWRVPRPGSQRPQSEGRLPTRLDRSTSIGTNSWAGHGTASSTWARPPDVNSRGFGSRRGRARRAQNV